jgi:RsiW-degrading membrane proteinase PrsW (M82 family)
MRKKTFIFGLIFLIIGLFVYDIPIEGIPIITAISGIITLFGLLSKRDQPGVTPIQVQHTSVCPNCREPIFPSQKFCGMCGQTLTQSQISADQTQIPIPTQVSISSGIKVNLAGNLVKAFQNLFAPRKSLINVTNTVYEKLPPIGITSSLRLIIVTVILFAGFYLLSFGEMAYSIIDSNMIYFIATYSVAFFYLLWIYRSDKYEREPFKFILFVFAWGVFSGIIAGPINLALGPLFKASFGNEALIGPFTEEPLKAIGLYYLVTRKRFMKEFNTPLDGIIYGFAVGLGFFANENFLYFLQASQQNIGEVVLVLRSFLTWSHGVWAATTGLWLALAKIQRGKVMKRDLIPGLMVALFLHSVWNAFNLYIQIGLMIFNLWYTRKIIKEALRDEVLWGYSQGLAPIE